MIAEALAIVASGVTIVRGVTQLLRSQRDNGGDRAGTELAASVRSVGARMAAVETELARVSRGTEDRERLGAAYRALLEAIRDDGHYSVHLEVVPTTYGTLKIVRRRNRKPTALRDPQGEYGLPGDGSRRLPDGPLPVKQDPESVTR